MADSTLFKHIQSQSLSHTASHVYFSSKASPWITS